LEQGALPPTALDLMRSRYSAYVLERFDYLKATWHPKTCPPDLGKDLGDGQRWLGLDVKKTTLLSESRATVEFVARYRIGARGYRLHERSLFECIDGRWTYREGEMLA
jgi:SEC-C motif-containing protein